MITLMMTMMITLMMMMVRSGGRSGASASRKPALLDRTKGGRQAEVAKVVIVIPVVGSIIIPVVTSIIRGCSHIMSAKNRGSYTPPPPSPLRQQWSAFG